MCKERNTMRERCEITRIVEKMNRWITLTLPSCEPMRVFALHNFKHLFTTTFVNFLLQMSLFLFNFISRFQYRLIDYMSENNLFPLSGAYFLLSILPKFKFFHSSPNYQLLLFLVWKLLHKTLSINSNWKYQRNIYEK